MTLIEDMSETQRQAWITLLVDGAVFIYFWAKMTTAGSIDTLTPSGLGYLALKVIIITIVLHAIINAVFAARTRGEHDSFKDERDIEIERKGNSYGFYVLSAFVYILAGQILLQNGFDTIPNTGEDYGYKSWFDYQNTSHLVFALFTASFVSDIIRNGAMILSYRGHGE